jgi:hypothetical protein
LCDVLVFIVALVSISQYGGQYTALALTDSELKTIETGGKVSITSEGPCQICQTPKYNKPVLSKVTTWLQQAKPYIGRIPKSDCPRVLFGGYIGPATMHITMPDKREITIKPAYYTIPEMTEHGKMYANHYVANVLELDYDQQRSYIQSSQLYNWLKNGKWKTEL